MEKTEKFTLTEEQIKKLPTEQDILNYEKLGWYISPVILPENILENAKIGADEYYKGNVDFTHPKIDGPANDIFDGTKALMNNEFVSIQKKEIRDIVHHPIVSTIAAKLARTSEIRLFADALMCKFPVEENEKGAFGWHTDKAYWPSCTSKKMLTAWIPLQDVTIDMGPMVVIENSHHWELEGELKKYCAAGEKNLKGLEDYLSENKTDYKYIPMTLKKGQLSFHHGDTFHASTINTSKLKRLTITIHMQDASNTYEPAFKENGEKIVIGYEKLCRKDSNGNPDYKDPDIFPVLFDEKK